ncbi:hypothetical protein HUN17_15915 [Acinetobacter seifertii]|nr:hypothetical protein [Acinetobacter seifertii]
MTVDNLESIDFISASPEGDVVLTISDHFVWGNDEHLYILQEKINKYIDFIESGDVYEKYEHAIGKKFVIELIYRFDPFVSDLKFLDKIKKFLSSIGIKFQFSKLVIGS